MDSNAQIQKYKKETLHSYPSPRTAFPPPTPLVIKFLYFSKQWFKEKFIYFYIILQIILQTTINWVISLKKITCIQKKGGHY